MGSWWPRASWAGARVLLAVRPGKRGGGGGGGGEGGEGFRCDLNFFFKFGSDCLRFPGDWL